MSEVQGPDDVGTVLRFLSHFLRVEMHQLWGDHRSHHFQQQKEKLGGSRYSTGGRSIIRRPSIVSDRRSTYPEEVGAALYPRL